MGDTLREPAWGYLYLWHCLLLRGRLGSQTKVGVGPVPVALGHRLLLFAHQLPPVMTSVLAYPKYYSCTAAAHVCAARLQSVFRRSCKLASDEWEREPQEQAQRRADIAEP